MVRARPTVERIVAPAAGEIVPTSEPSQDVVAVASAEDVRAIVPQQPVVEARSDDTLNAGEDLVVLVHHPVVVESIHRYPDG